MKRSNRWPRRAGAALAAALLASTGLGIGAGSVGAIPASGLDVLTTSPPTTIGLGMLNQAGGTLRIAPTDAVPPIETFAAGDQIRLFLDDSDAGANCSSATDFVTFASLPTVTNSGTATFTASLEESPGVCTAFAGTYNDVLLISITGAGSGVFDVTGIKLDNGVTTATGRISHSVVAAPATGISYPTGAPPMNGVAFIGSLLVAANNPPMGADMHPTLFQSPSPIVISEPSSTPAAADGATLCITLAGGNTFDLTGAAPTVAVSGAGSTDTASAVARTATTLSFLVTAGAPPAASTFTVSGFRTTRTATGPDFIDLGMGACPSGGLILPTTISTVIDVTRFGGLSRYETAALAFSDFGCTTDVVLVTGENYPDALSSTFLASVMGEGILLTPPNSIPNNTLNALRTGGTDIVHLVGGTSAISQAVEDQLKATPNFDCGGAIETNGLGIPLNLSVIRIPGATRYETMKNVVEFAGFGTAGMEDVDGTPTDPDGLVCAPLVTAVVATGENFPDALTAGQFAVGSDSNGCGDSGEFPVILTPSGALGAEASQALTNLGIEQVIIAGGTTAVSAAVETAIGAMGIATRRLSGPTRLDTAVAMATFKAQFLGAHDDSVLVVRGDNFADALVAPIWGGHNSNMVLTESPTSLGTPTATYLAMTDNLFPLNGPPVLDPFEELWLFGGSSAVTAPVLAAMLGQLSLVEAPE